MTSHAEAYEHLGPEFRNTLMGSDRQEILNRTGGRIASDSVYQCYHGDKIIPQTILEWQPFERIVQQTLIPILIPNTTALTEYRLVPTKTETRLVQLESKPEGPLFGRVLVNLMAPVLTRQIKKLTDAFKQRVEDDLRENRGVPEYRSDVSAETLREAAETSLSG